MNPEMGTAMAGIAARIRDALPWVWCLLAVCANPAAEQVGRAFELHNPLDWTRSAADVVIARADLKLEEGHDVTEVAVRGDGIAYAQPFQVDDLDGDGEWDELYFQVDIKADQRLLASVSTGPQDQAPTFPRRADAMADAAGRADLTKPAWESELITYVSYGAAQVDVIGRVLPRLSIDYLYREPTHSQHAFTVEHGMDFLSVGNTMGAHAPFVLEPDGTIVRPWTTDAYTVEGPLERDAHHATAVVSEGPLRAIVETRIERWISDLGAYACTIRYAIAAGQRHTRVRVVYDAFPDGDARPIIGAGTRAFREDLHLLEADDRLLVASRNILERGQLVPWMGRAILAPDAVELRPIRIPADATPEKISGSGPNYGALFPKASREVDYAFVACWSLDGAITSWAQFQDDMARLQREISVPIAVAPAAIEALGEDR